MQSLFLEDFAMQKIVLYIELVIFVAVTVFAAVKTEPVVVEIAEAKEETEEYVEEIQPISYEDIYFKDIVEVEYAFVDCGGCGRIKVKNNSENQLISYNMQVFYFDESRKPLDNKTVEISNVKIASGFSGGMEKYIPMVKDCKYLWARVKSAEFTAAPSWVNENMDDGVEMPLIAIEDIPYTGQDIADAESCSFLEITNASPAKEDFNSERQNLIFYVKNIGDKTIKNLNLIVAEFDENNKPVSAAPYIYIGTNTRQLHWKDIGLASGDGKKAVSQLVLEPDCKKVKIIVESVEFENGMVWNNGCALQWICSKMKY